MKKIFKKLLCSLLAVLMIVSIAPVQAYASTPAKVDDAILEERVALLRNFVKNNSYGYKYFTTTGQSCDNADSGHPSDFNCSKCETTNLIKATWIKNELGIMPNSTSLLPSPLYKYSGGTGSFWPKAWSCIGFTMIAHWFLYAQSNSDEVESTHIRTIDLTKSVSTIRAELDKYAKPGDMLIFRNSSSANTYSHGAIYLGNNSSGILVLDSNKGGSSGPTCKMQEYTLPYTWYKCVDISRAKNYVEHIYDDYGYCSHCGKYFEQINANKITPVNGTATKITFSKFYIKAHPYKAGGNQDELVAEECKVIGKIVNHKGNTWYKISYGSSKTGWIDSNNYKIDINNTINIELNMNKSSIPKGTSVWANDSSKAYNWYGKASSSNGVSKITSLTFEILKADGTLTANTNRITIKPNATSYTVKTSDDTMKFSSLAVGSYVLSLSATDENGKTANKKYNFTVYDNASSNVSVTGVNITQTSVTVSKGKTSSLTATVSPSNATNKAVTWSSSNTSVATVSSSGVVTGVSAGTAVITVTTKDGSYKDTCTVTVNPTVYNVNYNLNGGSANISNKEVTEGWYINLPSTVPTRPGYTFEGWQESGTAGTNGWVTTKPASGTYQTGYKYYIWGYECDHCRDYGYNYDVDYTFFYSKNKNDVISGVKANPQVYGSYTPSKLRYFYIIESANKGTSFYLGQSGSTYKYFNADYIAEDGKKGTASIYKTEFYLESIVYKQEATGGKIYQPGDSYNVKNDVTFTAIWKEVKGYNITFDPANGRGGPANMTTNGTEFTVPKEIPVRENWKFLYWMDQYNGKFEPGETAYIFEDRVLTACWAPYWFPEIKVGNTSGKPGETVAVPVYIYNAKEPNNTTVKFSVTSDGLTRTKYENAAVFPENGLFTTVYFEIPKTAKTGTYPVNFNLTEYKVLSGYYLTETVEITNGVITVEEPEPKTYTISYNANGGSGAPSAQTKTENKALTLSTTKPTRNGYEFLGWAAYANAGTAQYQPGGSYNENANVTLYAVWKQKEVIPADAPTIIIGEVSGRAGETVEVPVILKNNPGVASMKMNVKYDAAALEIVSAEINSDFKGATGAIVEENIDKNPILLNWMLLGDGNITGNTFAVITFKIKEEANEGKYIVSVTINEDDIYNGNGDAVPFEAESGFVEVTKYIPGDINNDGKVNNRDVTRLFQYLSGRNVEVVKNALDVNGDGKTNNRDVTRLFQYLSGRDVEIY